MDKNLESWKASMEELEEKISETLSRLAEAARPEAVFGEPQTIGECTLIPTNEVCLGLGVGKGWGYGSSGKPEGEPEGEVAEAREEPAEGFGGGGGGGGGGAHTRPVALIVVEPDGVCIKPVVDTTKLGIAAAIAWAAVFIQVLRLLRVRREIS